MNFGKYSIIDKVSHTFEQEPDWEWVFKPVTSGIELQRSKFMLHNRVVAGPDGVRREFPPTWLEIAHRELALTFGGTTIPKDIEKPVSEGGEPILPDNVQIGQIEAVLQNMPQDMVMELWRALGNVYPEWGPVDPKEPEKNG
jgi:hypothetical protein